MVAVDENQLPVYINVIRSVIHVDGVSREVINLIISYCDVFGLENGNARRITSNSVCQLVNDAVSDFEVGAVL